jgi:oligopeptide transport system substrate-binding protein
MESRTRSLPRWFVLGLAVVGLFTAVACGGDKQPAAQVGDLAPPEQQVLRLRLVAEPRTLDPHQASFATESSMMKPLFEGLFSYDQSLRVVAALAKEVPTTGNGGISKDGLTYTVKLDAKAKWSDGKEVMASDFVYSMKRALDPKLGSRYASFFYGIVGAQEYNTALGTKNEPKQPSDSDLARLRDGVGVSASDEHTIVYKLKQPNPSFLSLLALWTAYPVREDVVSKHGDKWTEAGNHIGNGPFVLREWSHNQRFVLEPNPYWHGEKAKLTRIVINFMPDDAAAYAAYLNGELDMVTVPPPLLKEVQSSRAAEVVKVPEMVTFALFMNNKVAPFDDVKVRQAFALAIDRDALVGSVLQGAGKPTTTWIPEGVPGHNPELGKQWGFNPTRAKQLLAEAGYPDGKGLPEVRFLAVGVPPVQARQEFIEAQLRTNLGIKVSTEYVDPPTFGRRFTTGQHQIAIANWAADWPYPDNWLPEQFASWGTNNVTSYSSDAFDQLMAKARAETDDRKRLALYDEAQKMILDQAVISPLYNRQSYVLVKPKLKGLFFTALDGEIKGDLSFSVAYVAAN